MEQIGNVLGYGNASTPTTNDNQNSDMNSDPNRATPTPTGAGLLSYLTPNNTIFNMNLNTTNNNNNAFNSPSTLHQGQQGLNAASVMLSNPALGFNGANPNMNAFFSNMGLQQQQAISAAFPLFNTSSLVQTASGQTTPSSTFFGNSPSLSTPPTGTTLIPSSHNLLATLASQQRSNTALASNSKIPTQMPDHQGVAHALLNLDSQRERMCQQQKTLIKQLEGLQSKRIVSDATLNNTNSQQSNDGGSVTEGSAGANSTPSTPSSQAPHMASTPNTTTTASVTPSATNTATPSPTGQSPSLQQPSKQSTGSVATPTSVSTPNSATGSGGGFDGWSAKEVALLKEAMQLYSTGVLTVRYAKIATHIGTKSIREVARRIKEDSQSKKRRIDDVQSPILTPSGSSTTANSTAQTNGSVAQSKKQKTNPSTTTQKDAETDQSHDDDTTDSTTPVPPPQPSQQQQQQQQQQQSPTSVSASTTAADSDTQSATTTTTTTKSPQKQIQQQQIKVEGDQSPSRATPTINTSSNSNNSAEAKSPESAAPSSSSPDASPSKQSSQQASAQKQTQRDEPRATGSTAANQPVSGNNASQQFQQPIANFAQQQQQQQAIPNGGIPAVDSSAASMFTMNQQHGTSAANMGGLLMGLPLSASLTAGGAPMNSEQEKFINDLLQKNVGVISQIRENLSRGSVLDNLDLIRSFRDNIINVLNCMSHMPGIMSQMPHIPVKLSTICISNGMGGASSQVTVGQSHMPTNPTATSTTSSNIGMLLGGSGLNGIGTVSSAPQSTAAANSVPSTPTNQNSNSGSGSGSNNSNSGGASQQQQQQTSNNLTTNANSSTSTS